VQSPSKTFTTPGSHTVALIATNGAGSATSVQSFLVASSEATAVAASSTDIAFTAAGAGRRRTFVNVAGLGVVRLELSSSAGSDTTLFLRFLDGGGRLLIERRLVVPAGHMAAYDLGAFGLRGTFNIELVGDTAVGATIVQTGRSTTEVSR